MLQKRKSGRAVHFAVGISVSLLVGLGITGIGFVILAKSVSQSNLSIPATLLPVVLVVCAGALISGFLMACAAGEKRLLWGLASGGFYGLCYLAAVSLQGGAWSEHCLLKAISFLISGALGGALSGQLGHRARRRR